MKKVWSASIDLGRITAYRIGSSYDGLFDYRTYRLNEIAIRQNPTHPDSLILKQKNQEDWNRICKAAAAADFEKSPVFPNSLWADKMDYPKDDEYVFFANGRIVFNQQCGEIFKQFNLGQSDFAPIHIYDIETGELWKEETFYILDVSEQRRYMLNPQSHSKFKFIRYPSGLEIYSPRYGIRDNYVELSASAQECNVDLWHDPLLLHSYFMSEPLQAALSEADMAHKFGFALCKLI
ncbi:hypothetical protein [Alysiella filiformis]|uniref:Uncharacterized protein n=1 Tax=Alysiella filiformis DSM 16848 TaxID=1120981 RepID=A0A286ED05_9NEIS|nr:hypothetical protein [Alysiella filiformis]QMT31922.1 hypothetical protein H3L97_03325 [Alysiella filiformis]UBQ57171.1 hypothetical protein JF568_05350 [Alysiella filiformis DSM 16848]SOD68768.1 hypothetical protein SAMN02746062_01395 [Alysiella filiformis DSM 16848]